MLKACSPPDVCCCRVVVRHLVHVPAVRPVAASSGRAGPADVAGVLRALAAGHAPVAGAWRAAGARLVETCRGTDSRCSLRSSQADAAALRHNGDARLTADLTLQDAVPDQRHLLHLGTGYTVTTPSLQKVSLLSTLSLRLHLHSSSDPLTHNPESSRLPLPSHLSSVVSPVVSPVSVVCHLTSHPFCDISPVP